MQIQLIALLIAAIGTVAETGRAQEPSRIHLRNDARLVQTMDAENVNLRCEKMGGPEVREPRWIKDCNRLAYSELQRMSREGRLGVDKLPGQPLGNTVVNNTLSVQIPLRRR
jgi:hypothetical protein